MDKKRNVCYRIVTKYYFHGECIGCHHHKTESQDYVDGVINYFNATSMNSVRMSELKQDRIIKSKSIEFIKKIGDSTIKLTVEVAEGDGNVRCPQCNYTTENEYIYSRKFFKDFLSEAESPGNNITFNQYCDVMDFMIINNFYKEKV